MPHLGARSSAVSFFFSPSEGVTPVFLATDAGVGAADLATAAEPFLGLATGVATGVAAGVSFLPFLPLSAAATFSPRGAGLALRNRT